MHKVLISDPLSNLAKEVFEKNNIEDTCRFNKNAHVYWNSGGEISLE